MPSEVRIEIEETRYEVVPGEPFDVVVHIYNATPIIDGFAPALLGLDPDWAVADEVPLSLFPENEGDMTLTIELPRVYPSGDHEIGIKISSTTDDTIFAVQVITLAVASAEEAFLAIDPQSVTAGKTARYGLSVHNVGNTVLNVAIRGSDPEKVCEFAFEPEEVEVQPGERADVQAKVTGKRPWLGSPTPRVINFEAVGTGEPLQTIGSFVQKARIPRALLLLLVVLLVLGTWAAIVVFGIDTILDRNEPDVEPGGLFVTMDSVAAAFAADQEAAAEAAAAEAEAAAEEAAAAAAEEAAAAAALVGTISGTVSAEGLAPPQVAGATVTAFSTDNPATTDVTEEEVEVASAETGEDGTYLIADLPAGSYKVRFTGAGYSEVWYAGVDSLAEAAGGARRLSVTGNGGQIEIDALLTGETGTVAGTILDEATGEPMAGVTVTLDALGPLTAGDGAAAEEPPPAGDNGAVVDASFSTADVAAATNAVFNTEFAAPQALLLQAPLVFPATIGVATTDQDGNFQIDDVPTPRTFRLKVEVTDFEEQVMRFALGPGESRLDITASLSGTPGTIIGTVLDNRQRPVGGVTIVISGGDTEVTVKTLTTPAEDIGEFTAADLPPGDYSLALTKDGFVTQEVQVAVGAGDEIFQLITLEGGAGSISGVVTADGQPLGGVEIVFTGEDGSTVSAVSASKATADAPAGSYAVKNLATPGTYSGSFAKDGFVSGFLTVNLAGAEDKTGIDITLEQGGTVTGKVIDRQGKPISGVTVTLTDAETTKRTAFTDGAGTYEIVAMFEVPPPYTILFQKSSYQDTPGPSVESVAADQTVALADITMLGNVGSIVAELKEPNATGGTVASDNVTVTVKENGVEVTSAVFTEGKMSLPGLATPGDYLLEIRRNGLQHIDREVRVGAGAAVDLKAITLGVPGSVSGTVKSRLGDPLAGATVKVISFTDPAVTLDLATVPSVTTEADGTFTIPNAPAPGVYTLSVSLSNYVTTQAVATLTQPAPNGSPSQPIVVVGEPATVTGTVYSNVFGDPLPGINVELVDTVAASRTTVTDASGRFSVGGLDTPAKVTLKVGVGTASYQPFTSAQIPIAPGQTVDENVLLGFLASSISGTVTCSSGSDPTGVEVELFAGSNLAASTTPNSKGQYVFHSLTGTATYRVEFVGTPAATISGIGLTFPASAINPNANVAC